LTITSYRVKEGIDLGGSQVTRSDGRRRCRQRTGFEHPSDFRVIECRAEMT
jgi:hypothetical protein